MDVGEMQKKLSQTATRDPNHKFGDLYSLLCNDTWLRVAQLHVNANQGSETAGVDRETMSRFLGDLDGNITRLQASLKAKTCEPMPVRRVYIPKAHGKQRPIGIPTIVNRIVQEALRMILEPIWEADFSIHAYGFRPNRSTYDAVATIYNRLVGNGWTYQWIIRRRYSELFRRHTAPAVHEGGQAKNSRQGYPRCPLEIPACRGARTG